MNRNAIQFVEAAQEKYGQCATLNRDQVQIVCDESGAPYPYWFVSRPQYRAGRGLYALPSLGAQSVSDRKSTRLNSSH